MNLYIYSDESGVFDKVHNDIFVFGGVVFLSKNERDICNRKYLTAEQSIRQRENKTNQDEVKAATITNEDKGKLFRSLNQIEKFGIVIHQNKVFDTLFEAKKTKQRYLDWAYKMAVKKKMEDLIQTGKINPEEVERLYFYVDEHTTATNGVYELRESIEQEFRYGLYNFDGMKYYPPLFKNAVEIQMKYCDSKTVPLVRAADIVANKLYHMAMKNDYSGTINRHFYVEHHPPM